MPTPEKKYIQIELPGFEKVKKIREVQREALDPSKEKSQIYDFPKGTPIYLGGYYPFCETLYPFQAIKLKKQKISGLAAFKLLEGVHMKILAGKNEGEKGYLGQGKIFGAYTSKGDYQPKKTK
jgi:hypothetical protein